MELRPYQQEARAAVERQWAEGNRRTLLVLPTGCGKTIVFAKVAEDCVKQGRRVLILAHRGDMRSLGSYFESLAYEYSLPKAIRERYAAANGWKVPYSINPAEYREGE